MGPRDLKGARGGRRKRRSCSGHQRLDEEKSLPILEDRDVSLSKERRGKFRSWERAKREKELRARLKNRFSHPPN